MHQQTSQIEASKIIEVGMVHEAYLTLQEVDGAEDPVAGRLRKAWAFVSATTWAWKRIFRRGIDMAISGVWC